MGRYFGLVNHTKKHLVSSYWKGAPPLPEEMVKIAESLNWDLKTDKIISSSYCDYGVWNGEDFEERDMPDSTEEEDKSKYKKFDWNGEKIGNNFDPIFFCN